MKNIRKISFITATFLMLNVFSLTACTKEQTEPTEPKAESKEYDPRAGIDFSSEKKYFVQDGVSLYKIVVPQNADECIEYVARELKSLIFSASGAELAIVKENAAVESDGIISIGETRQSAFVETDEEDLNIDGFRIVTKDEDVFIKGANSTATMYGVFDFAEKMMGVRFLASDYTYVPQNENLFFHSLNIKEVPVFETRCYFADSIVSDAYNAAHMRTSCPFGTNLAETGRHFMDEWYPSNFHSSDLLLPPETYAQEYSDWYGNGQLCLTNGIDENGNVEITGNGMAKQALENLKRWIKDNPTVTNFMIGENDGGSYCKCATCNQSYQANGGYSGTKIIFVNALAREIEKWAQTEYPEREITLYTFAYASSKLPPINDKGEPVNEKVVPEKNVGILLAQIGCRSHELGDEKCEEAILEERYIEEWSALTDNLVIYDYQVNFNCYFFYLPHLPASKTQLKKYDEVGIDKLIITAAPSATDYYQGLLDTYLYSKLLWNPYRNVLAIVEEFNRLYFTDDYAKYADDLFYQLEGHFELLDEQNSGEFHTDITFDALSNGADFYNAKHYPIALLESLEKNIKQGIAHVQARVDLTAGEREEIIKRLTKLLIIPQYMILLNYNFYYDSGEKAYAEAFFANTDMLGLTHWGEKLTLLELKQSYGVVS